MVSNLPRRLTIILGPQHLPASSPPPSAAELDSPARTCPVCVVQLLLTVAAAATAATGALRAVVRLPARSDVWNDPLPLGATLGMLWLDTALYLLLAAYFDKVRAWATVGVQRTMSRPVGPCRTSHLGSSFRAVLVATTRGVRALRNATAQVIPSGYGPTLPFPFPCRPQYWQPCVRACRGAALASSRRLRAALRGDNSPSSSSSSRALHEGMPLLTMPSADLSAATPAPPRSTGMDRDGGGGGGGGAAGQRPAVEIRGLHMRYPNGVVAVRDLSLTMHHGQITALLGAVWCCFFCSAVWCSCHQATTCRMGAVGAAPFCLLAERRLKAAPCGPGVPVSPFLLLLRCVLSSRVCRAQRRRQVDHGGHDDGPGDAHGRRRGHRRCGRRGPGNHAPESCVPPRTEHTESRRGPCQSSLGAEA